MNPETDTDANALVAEVQSMIPNRVPACESADDYEMIGGRLRDARALEKRIEARRREMTKPLDEAKRSIMEFFRSPLDRLAKLRAGYEGAMRLWHAEEDRRRREAERAAAEAARKAREAAERAAAEERARAEEQARKAREKAEAQARKMEEAGRAEMAEAKRRAAAEAEERARAAAEAEAERRRIEAEMAPAAPVVQADPAKAAGVHRRRSWKFRIIDPAAVPREYLSIDEVTIGRVVRALGADTSIPGVEVYEDVSVVARTA